MTTNSDPIRWGILGTGRIAHSLATDLMLVPDGRLAAVGSRSKESAETFAKEYAADGPVRAYGSYEELAADEDVDVVYVASPTPTTSSTPPSCSKPASTCCARRP